MSTTSPPLSDSSTSPPKPVYVFSDCHLTLGRPERTQLVLRFLDHLRDKAGLVIILGDLFDFWLGAKHLLLPDYRGFLDKLRELTRGGLDIRMIPGNRDFLLDERFAERTGIKLLGDVFDLRVGSRLLRFTHGDLLCTSDWRYLLWRRVVRQPVVRWCIGVLPLFFTRWMALCMRRISENEVRRKTRRYGSGLKESAAREILGVDADLLVSGHAHLPESRPVSCANSEKTLYLLGDWNQDGIYLIVSPNGLEYRKFTVDGDCPFEAPLGTWNERKDRRPWDRRTVGPKTIDQRP